MDGFFNDSIKESIDSIFPAVLEKSLAVPSGKYPKIVSVSPL